MSKTPSKSVDSTNWIFNHKELTTPNKDNPGLSKTVYTHVTNLHRLINDWLRVRDKGTSLCMCISALKLEEFEDDYYPPQLKPLMLGLMEAVASLKNIVNCVQVISGQMRALAKLQTSAEPVIYTWSATAISQQIDKTLIDLEKEYTLKELVIENIAHCRDERLIEVYVSSWEFEVYVDIDDISYLFAEVGLTGLN